MKCTEIRIFFSTNRTPDLNRTVINDRIIDVASRPKILCVNVSSELKMNDYIVEVVQKARGTPILSFSIKARRSRP